MDEEEIATAIGMLENIRVIYDKILKENAELKARIEKMRNCHNCKWNGLQLTKDCGNDCAKNNKEKWELAE